MKDGCVDLTGTRGQWSSFGLAGKFRRCRAGSETQTLAEAF